MPAMIIHQPNAVLESANCPSIIIISVAIYVESITAYKPSIIQFKTFFNEKIFFILKAENISLIPKIVIIITPISIKNAVNALPVSPIKLVIIDERNIPIKPGKIGNGLNERSFSLIGSQMKSNIHIHKWTISP